MLLVWTLLSMPVQAVCLALPGRPKVVFARTYWRVFAHLLGIRLRTLGALSTSGRPVLYVSNHSSWVDVAVLGGVLPGCFVAKGEVGTWPVISWIAQLGRTVYVSRRRNTTGRELDDLRDRLASGDNLILFPEGTTSHGARMRPFRSSFFAAAEGPEPPLVQPVSIVYDRLAGLPTGRLTRGLFAWTGDQDIASHYWQLAQRSGLRASVLLHRTIDPRDYSDRKALTQAVWTVVADGVAALYQHRAAEPIMAPSPATEGVGEARTA